MTAGTCTETASCQPGDHTYSWPCDLARTDEDTAAAEAAR